MSGYDVARAIRNDPALSSVLLVAITGWGQPEDRRKAREAGFDHHRVKPVDTGDIEQLIAAAPDQDGRRAD
jgi:CheY-like chemotaxis protein